MQAEIIAIGDEILIGQTLDTNSQYTAAQLNAQGIRVLHKRVIADEREAILHALESIHPKTNLVFMTGGLGPTKDDITKATLLEFFGGEMEFHQEVYDHIVELFRSFNRVPKESNKGQAYLPNSCTPILNELGTAPGMRFEKEGVYYFSTPGVPYETEHLVSAHIIPWINTHLQKGQVVHRTVLTQGVPESELQELIAEWEAALPAELHLAYLPSAGMVKLRLTSYTLSREEAEAQMDRQLDALKEILGDVLFGEGASSLEEVVGLELQKRNMTLATAESCTGGYIASKITSVPGSSAYFLGAVVSYANAVKVAQLGVDPKAIEQEGAVSEIVVRQMAEGVRSKMDASFAIATSGVAGPSGGSEAKPVGTVWIAITGPDGTLAKRFQFGLNRQRNIRKSTLMALDWLRKELQKIN